MGPEANRGKALLVAALIALGSGTVLAQSRRAVAEAAPPTPAAGVAAEAATGRVGALLGLVTDAAGRPQAGAVVVVRSSGLHSAAQRRLTSAQGLFTLAGLVPGTYYVEVGKGARIAARREIEIHASERALLLVNLPQLLQSVQFGPPAGVKGDEAFDWALRQATVWRPILRLNDDDGSGTGDTGRAAGAVGGDGVQGYVALTAGGGSSALDAPELATDFRLDTGVWGDNLMSLTGAVGTSGLGTGLGSGSDTRLQASFRPRDAASSSRLVVALRQVELPGLPTLPALRVMSLDYANGLSLGDRLRLQYGALINAVSMTDTVSTFDPYLRASYRIGDEGQLEYRAVSAVPPVRFTRDFAEMADPTPQVTLDHDRARLEHARHQELLYSDSLTPNDTVAASVFEENFSRAAINGAYGAGTDTTALADESLLPDLLNNMFIANGGGYGGWGYRLVYDHRLSDDWHADFGYSSGPVLAPAAADFGDSLADALVAARAQAVTFKVVGVTPLTHTHLICSYRALSRPTATGLDLYDDGLAQSDSYANVYLRQPLPQILGGGNRIEALVEIRNLLAQGYIPLMDSDGHTLYLVQSARSLRGGFTISF